MKLSPVRFIAVLMSVAVMCAVSPLPARAADIQQAPNFSKKDLWIQGEPLNKRAFKDKVTLVYFFDYATVNAIREFERLEDWSEAYEPFGFQVILVHAPEFAFAFREKNVRKAVRRMGLPFSVVLDNDAKLWEGYKNLSWPTKHVVNGRGEIVMTQVGEGGYIPTENAIRESLLEIQPDAALPPPVVTEDPDRFDVWECGEMSTEIYTGYKRAAWWGVVIANRDNVLPDEEVDYFDKGRRVERGFFLAGRWANREEYFEFTGDGQKWDDYLGIIYLGAEVYAVLEQLKSDKPSRVYIERDGAPVPEAQRGSDLKEDSEGRTFLEVGDPRLYYLIENEDSQYHELKLIARDPGLAAYVFSFSNQCLTDFSHR